MRTQVESLSELQFKDFLIRLWSELTIAGQAIWSDERIGQETQLRALKWLNEIQHRVSVAYQHGDKLGPSWLLDRPLLTHLGHHALGAYGNACY